jgi:hypothetical protein
VGGPVFVVGTMRSGSTLLRLMLDSHENIAIPPETGFMGAIEAMHTIPHFKNGAGWYERLGWSRQEIDERLRTLFGEIFQRYATQHGKPRWGEKTPFHSWHVAAMAATFPDAVFVGIVRHPGAVAASLRDRFHWELPGAVDYWADTNAELLQQATSLGPRMVLCRYEELVTEPEPLMRSLLSWLGEPWSARVLTHHEVQQKQGAPRMTDGSTITRDPIESSRAWSWVGTLSADDRTALAGAATVTAALGYAVDGPGPSSWGLPDGSVLAERPEVRAVLDRDPPIRPIDPDADPVQLARRLADAEAALLRQRNRRSVRLGEAVRKVQRNRTPGDVWSVVQILRERSRGR